MKLLLTGTTVLAATGLLTGPSFAASELKLGITGFYRNALGTSFGHAPTTRHIATSGGRPTSVSTAGLGNFDRQAVSLRQQVRIDFTGQTRLDNGMTVGILIGLDGE